MSTDRCASIARALQEPLPGSAPEATGWLLVEDPGPWGRDALADGTLDEETTATLQAALADQPMRYQAIRRVHRERGAERTVFLVHSGPSPWARRLKLGTAAIGDLDPSVTLSAIPPEIGEPHSEPLLLVCTHGKRDACCAERGREVAVGAASLEPAATWETSHTGGHRFAPSVIVLPVGAVYGFMDETRALAAVQAVRERRISLDGLRGRSATSRTVQAAEVWVRNEFGLDGLRDVVLEETVAEGEVALVRLRLPDQIVTMRVRRRPLDPRPVSCGADAKVPETWGVVDRVR